MMSIVTALDTFQGVSKNSVKTIDVLIIVLVIVALHPLYTAVVMLGQSVT